MLNSFTNATTLVVAGAWNPDILSPSWVAKNAMGQVLDQDFPVDVELPIGNPTQRPTYAFGGIRYVASKSTIQFYLIPQDINQVDKSIDTVTKILELLVHTPVSGLGFNFSYQIDEPSVPLLETFAPSNILPSLLDDSDAQAVVRTWSSSVKTQDRLLTFDSRLEGGKVALKFNFHFEVSSASDAFTKLKTPNLFKDVKEVASNIAQKLHDLGDA